MITLWDRKNQKLITEKVYAGKVFKLLYGNSKSHFFTKLFLERKWFSYLYGLSKKTIFSKNEIKSFIEKYEINMDEFKYENFKNFNDFFKRDFKKSARLFPILESEFGSICEGRVVAFDNINMKQEIKIKNNKISTLELLDFDNKLAEKYDEGALIIYRLAPVDYHHFHSPSSGILHILKKKEGRLHSVNPISTMKNPKVLIKNTRIITEIRTENGFDFCLIAVGAFCVGTIKSIPNLSMVKKYNRLGFFEFGGSTVVLLAQKGHLKIDQDILKKTKESTESFIRLGEKMANVQILKN